MPFADLKQLFHSLQKEKNKNNRSRSVASLYTRNKRSLSSLKSS